MTSPVEPTQLELEQDAKLSASDFHDPLNGSAAQKIGRYARYALSLKDTLAQAEKRAQEFEALWLSKIGKVGEAQAREEKLREAAKKYTGPHTHSYKDATGATYEPNHLGSCHIDDPDLGQRTGCSCGLWDMVSALAPASPSSALREREAKAWDACAEAYEAQAKKLHLYPYKRDVGFPFKFLNPYRGIGGLKGEHIESVILDEHPSKPQEGK